MITILHPLTKKKEEFEECANSSNCNDYTLNTLKEQLPMTFSISRCLDNQGPAVVQYELICITNCRHIGIH